MPRRDVGRPAGPRGHEQGGHAGEVDQGSILDFAEEQFAHPHRGAPRDPGARRGRFSAQALAGQQGIGGERREVGDLIDDLQGGGLGVQDAGDVGPVVIRQRPLRRRQRRVKDQMSHQSAQVGNPSDLIGRHAG
ncbi:MAG: hypothetical protein C4551_04930 [Bacillota bacterium]|nr:MAG: hypothetical protein C4551_04930 [Bacillota bacterium]